MSLLKQKNIDYADKLAHLKACKSLSSKGIKQLSIISEPTEETFMLLKVFSDVINCFKKSKYRLDPETFCNWPSLREYLRSNYSTLPNEAGAVKAKIDRMQFDASSLKRLKKEFDTKIK